MKEPRRQQILVGGVGGQGVLFVTSLLAEAAILKGLPVLTSETHGMAQRGGTVVSHLKVGSFSSPMIRPGRGDVLLALKLENVPQLEPFLAREAWIVANRASRDGSVRPGPISGLDAEAVAGRIGNPKSANLVLLGFALAKGSGPAKEGRRLFCSFEDLKTVLKRRLAGRQELLQSSLRALEAGREAL